MLSADKDKSAASKDSTPEGASKRREDGAETPKQQLLDIIGNMKVEVSYRKKLQQLKASESKKQALNKLEGPDSEGSVPRGTTEDTQRYSVTSFSYPALSLCQFFCHYLGQNKPSNAISNSGKESCEGVWCTVVDWSKSEGKIWAKGAVCCLPYAAFFYSETVER